MTRKLLYILFASAMLMGGNFKAAAAPIIEVNATDFNQVGISFNNGVLHITGAAGLSVSVYNIVGQKVYEGRIDSSDKRIELNLPANCYIVKVGSVARKISVKR